MHKVKYQHLRIENNSSFLGLEREVCLALNHIDKQDICGLYLIRLEDSLPPLSGNVAHWAKIAQNKSHHVYGWYAPSKNGRPPYIVLYAQESIRAIPKLLRTPSVLALRMVRSLAHEVAHHLQATRGYILENNETGDEELLANSYAAKVTQQMLKTWRYRVSRIILKEIANWHYVAGHIDWQQKQFVDSAYHFFAAWDLDPENINAGNRYWRAKEMSELSQLD